MKTGVDIRTLFRWAFSAPRHVRWALFWVAGIALVWGWDLLFLNRPALAQIETALLNSLLGGLLVVLFSMLLGWATGVGLQSLERGRNRLLYLSLSFLLNLLRSVPQIVGILMGYVVVTALIVEEILRSPIAQVISMSLVISLFVFLDVTDLIRERIAHYRKLDFFDAMLCCGIKESRIINVEILLKNSLAHIVHKAVALFGMAIFLQCSIDFILSVGLSTDVSSANLPVTLGSLLARMDSKQDILAIGMVFSDLSYAHALFFRHLQGLNIAFMIVYTLLCAYHIANGLVRRYHLEAG